MSLTRILTILLTVAVGAHLAAQHAPRPVDERGAPPRAGAELAPAAPSFDPADYATRPLPVRTARPGVPPDAGPVLTYRVATGTETVAPPDVQHFLGGIRDRVAGSGGAATGETELDLMLRDNFGALSLVSDSKPFPWRMNVKLFMTFPSSRAFVGSGVLIDPRHVLTAGHCVHDVGEGGWAQGIVVVPSYDGDQSGSAQRPYGRSSAVQLHTWTGWANNQSWAHDMGIIDLGRPVGALTGWFGFGYDSNATFFTDPTWHHASYPGESPYNGNRMYYQYGDFDHCPNNLEARFDRYSYGGESGSGHYKWIGETRYVFAILSNGNSSQTWCTRLDSGKFNDVGNVIDADRPSSFDLTPLAAYGSSAVDRGSRIDTLGFSIHNYSKAASPTRIDFSVYLSTNDYISIYDRKLGDYYVNVTVNQLGTVLIAWNPGTGPLVPVDVPTGAYYVGFILTTPDADPGNQYTLADDVAQIDVYEQSSFTTWGAGCQGSNGRTPSIGVFGQPLLGQTFHVTCYNTEPYAPVILNLGLSPVSIPLAGFGAPGCSVLVDPLIPIDAFANSVGAALLPISVNDPVWLGQAVFLQWLARDSSANRLGWTVSDAATMVIGTR